MQNIMDTHVYYLVITNLLFCHFKFKLHFCSYSCSPFTATVGSAFVCSSSIIFLFPLKVITILDLFTILINIFYHLSIIYMQLQTIFILHVHCTKYIVE